MRIGVFIPNVGEIPAKVGVARMAIAAEEAGAQSLWVGDHILMVDDPSSRYPYSADGRPPWILDTPWYDSLTVCSHLAAVTKTCTIGIGVLILPQRNVLELAKITATLDALSGGRFVLGVGYGWLAAEMEALGYDFGTRAQRAEEMTEVLRSCWTGRPEARHGDHVRVASGLIFQPRPLAGTVPIVVGAMKSRGLRWAASQDGWLAIMHAHELNEHELGESLELISRLRQQLGLADRPFRNILRLLVRPDMMELQGELAYRIRRLGFHELVVDCPWTDIARSQRILRDIRAAQDMFTG